MNYAAWIIGFLLLTLFFDNKLEQTYNPNQQVESNIDKSGVISVVLQRNRYGHYVTNGFINSTQVQFMLDTGATDVSIPEPIAQQIGLEYGRVSRVNTANGSIEVYQTILDELRIGQIRLYGVRANINPYMEGPGILLGMSALKQLEFTQRGKQLTLKQY